MNIISRGFRGRRQDGPPDRVPPGQYLTDDFPVLSAGPTPHTQLEEWTFTIDGGAEPVRWTWEELQALPSEEVTVDIHCVTKWSKLGTTWTGVSLDTLLAEVETEAEYLTAWCDGDYTTNLTIEDISDGKAWIAYDFEGEPLDPEHGGPARLLVPHLYLWKSAKWIRRITFTPFDEPVSWTWDELQALPSETVTVDIHCVTKWSKLDTVWTGVSVDTLLEGVETSAEFVVAFSDGGYTTNLPLEDVTGGKAWVATAYDGEPLDPEHGGPARLLVPHLYFWKSAKWARGLDLREDDEPGFWEGYGYHNYGDPWQEQRYSGD